MFVGVRAGLVGVGGELDAARLAAAAHLHLGLDHDRVADAVGDLDRLVDRGDRPRRRTRGCRSARRAACLGIRRDPRGGIVVDPARPHHKPERFAGRRVVHRLPWPSPRSDTKLLLVAAGAVIVAGCSSPRCCCSRPAGRRARPSTQPFDAGVAVVDPASELKNGGPFFVPDPFGGEPQHPARARGRQGRGARPTSSPGTKDCRVRWRGSIDSFVDCHDDKVREHRPRPLPVGDRRSSAPTRASC